MNCPACGTANPDGSRFCNACGNRLDAAAGGELDPFLPRELLAKLEAARAGRAMEGERRVVTMLFCDVKGSTAMAETMDPEDWTEIMNGAFERLIAPVYRYEGTLARLMGDAIFAFFGAPIAHEDDPQRAVGAGLEIISGIASYKEEVRARHGLDLDVRVGVHTGPVMVGQVGSDLRLEYTAMGDAVNVAARMEQTAEPGSVQITAETYKLVESLFDVESRGGVEVKGKAEPVEAYTVTGRRHAHGAVREMRDSPLVGRERELDELTRAIEETQAGGGRIVSIVGEAGLGKSRLIAEARAEWDRRAPDAHTDEAHRGWETWQCVSYDVTRPYAQYRRRVARVAGIDDTDAPEVVRTKLAGTMGHGWEDRLDPHMQVWRSLFGVTEPDEQALEGEAFRDAITELVTSSTRSLGAEPRLLVFEDLHWCDEASMDVLIETAKLVDDIPSLFVFAFRPDRQAPSWRLKQWLETEYPHRSVELTLTPLSADASERLIDALIPDEAADVRAQILARSDGNPLFLEEVTAAVHEHHVDIAIPTTLQALFTARLDALDEQAKHTLQLASVIGRSFTEPVLQAVSGDDVTASLRTLERAGLIVETARTPEREYAFRHSLTQDATYGTILLRRRRELHRRVAEVFEERSANRLEAAASLLAQHAREAGDDERTLRYATLAADADARLYANAETVTHTTWAIDAAKALGQPQAALDGLYTMRGRALELSGRIKDAVATYEEMESVADASGHRTAALAASLKLTTLYATPTPVFDAVVGRTLCERTIALARELGDRAAESKALWNLMTLNTFSGGDPKEAVRAGERSLANARVLDLREQVAYTLYDLWRPYAASGDLTAARAVLEESRPLWQELENLPMYCENLSSTGALLALAGDNAGSLALTAESHRIAGEIGNLWGQSYSLLNSYHVQASMGRYGRALAEMRECLESAEASGFMIPLAATRADMGALYANLGEVAQGAELAAEGLAIAERVNALAVPLVMASVAEVALLDGRLDDAQAAIDRSITAVLPGLLAFSAAANAQIQRGRLAAIRGDHDGALEVADHVLTWLRPLGVRPYEANALLLKGTSLAALGRPDEAEAALMDGRDAADELAFTPVGWKIDMALSRLASDAGDAPRAAELRERAKTVVERLAASIDDEALRASFLALPEVEAVTTGGTLAQ
jgi:class 3 adenylate cyclase/tetratricopeptide (TPR) repeat protein